MRQTLICSFRAAAAALCSIVAGTFRRLGCLPFSRSAQCPTAARWSGHAAASLNCRSRCLRQSVNISNLTHLPTYIYIT